MQLWAIIVDSLRESLDRKIFWVVLAITMLVALAMASVGFEGNKVSLVFGLWDLDSGPFNPIASFGRARLLGLVVYLVLDIFLGWIGIILMIVATASFFPSMIASGAVDILLAKPISRPRLFLYKYLSSMVFVFVHGTVFVLLTFLVMWLRWGVWAPGYLMSIPLLVLLFSYVYCVTVYVGIRTRSTVTAILISLGAWVVFAAPPIALDTFEAFPRFKEHQRLYQSVRMVSWIPPKVSDFVYMAARFADAGTSIDIFPESLVSDGSQDRQEQLKRAREIEERQLHKSPWLSIGSSLAFEFAVVMLAMWHFSRKDY